MTAGLLVMAIAASACSGGAGTTIPSPGSSTPLRPLPRPSGHSVDPAFDFGQEIEITTDAFVPRELVAAVGFPITWRNNSAQTQVIHFDNNGGIESEPIPPGGTWAYTPGVTISIVYHSTVDPAMKGGVQVEPLTEP